MPSLPSLLRLRMRCAWFHDRKVKFEVDGLAGNKGEHLLALPVYGSEVLRRLEYIKEAVKFTDDVGVWCSSWAWSMRCKGIEQPFTGT